MEWEDWCGFQNPWPDVEVGEEGEGGVGLGGTSGILVKPLCLHPTHLHFGANLEGKKDLSESIKDFFLSRHGIF